MEIIEVLHIVGAIFLVGPVAMVGMFAPRYIRTANADGIDLLGRVALTFGIGTLVVGLLGFGLIGGEDDGDWSFSDPWILASIAVFLVAVALTLGVLVPTLKTAGTLARTGGETSGLAARALLGGMVPTVLYLVVAVLMVTKPGA